MAQLMEQLKQMQNRPRNLHLPVSRADAGADAGADSLTSAASLGADRGGGDVTPPFLRSPLNARQRSQKGVKQQPLPPESEEMSELQKLLKKRRENEAKRKSVLGGKV